MSYELTISLGELGIAFVLGMLLVHELLDDIRSWYQSRDNGRDNDDVK